MNLRSQIQLKKTILVNVPYVTDMSSLDYGVFDFYMIILAIIGAFTKKND